MALGEDCPAPPKNQPPAKILWRKRRVRRPRRRVCLLKGCERVFRPQQPLARYCSEACRAEARRWRQWKARRRYRHSPNGKQKRQAQSRRYRERRQVAPERKTVIDSAARVIPIEFFFVLLRPSGVLCGIPAQPAFTPAAVLFPPLPPRAGTGSGAGAALAPTTRGLAVDPSSGENGQALAAMKAADIVRAYCTQSFRVATFSLRTTRRGRGSEARRCCATSFSLLLHEGSEGAGWNWNFINSCFATSG
jgi:hypothetical protein